jgi:hypothetical protein
MSGHRRAKVRALSVSGKKPRRNQIVEDPFGRMTIQSPEPGGLSGRQTQPRHLEELALNATEHPRRDVVVHGPISN